MLDPKTGEPVVNPETGQIFKENKWQIPEGGIFDLSALAEVEVQLNEDNKTVWVELAEEDRSRIEDVRSQVMLVDGVDEDGKFSGVYLGDDNSTEEDWQSGKFESTFNGQWLMLDGHIVLSEVVSDSTKKNKRGKKVDGSELFSIPITLNDNFCVLLVSCTYPDKKFHIIGARPAQSGQTTLDGYLLSLDKGDVVQPVYLSFNASENDIENIEMEALRRYNRPFDDLPIELQNELSKGYIGLVAGNSFTIGDTPKIEMGTLPDGKYAYMFEFVTPIGGEVRTNQSVGFLIDKGKIAVVKHLQNIEDIKELELEK